MSCGRKEPERTRQDDAICKLMFSGSRNYKEAVKVKVTWLMEEKRGDIQRGRA